MCKDSALSFSSFSCYWLVKPWRPTRVQWCGVAKDSASMKGALHCTVTKEIVLLCRESCRKIPLWLA